MELAMTISLISGSISIIVALIGSFTSLHIAKKDRKERNFTKTCTELCNNLELFYKLEDEYTKLVAELRTEKGMQTYNKPDSIKREMRDKVRASVNDADFTYKPSHLKEYKKMLDID